MTHAWGDAITLSGVVSSNVLNVVTGAITTVPYVGAIVLEILPPGASAYNQHSINTASDGSWEYVMKPSETGYDAGRWSYRVTVAANVPGASWDLYFDVKSSFAQTTTAAP